MLQGRTSPQPGQIRGFPRVEFRFVIGNGPSVTPGAPAASPRIDKSWNPPWGMREGIPNPPEEISSGCCSFPKDRAPELIQSPNNSSLLPSLALCTGSGRSGRGREAGEGVRRGQVSFPARRRSLPELFSMVHFPFSAAEWTLIAVKGSGSSPSSLPPLQLLSQPFSSKGFPGDS